MPNFIRTSIFLAASSSSSLTGPHFFVGLKVYSPSEFSFLFALC